VKFQFLHRVYVKEEGEGVLKVSRTSPLTSVTSRPVAFFSAKSFHPLNFFVKFFLASDKKVAESLGSLDGTFNVSVRELELDSSAELNDEGTGSEEGTQVERFFGRV